MYFNEKEDTNIDKEFKREFNFGDFLRENLKKIIIIGIILLLLIVVLFIFLKSRGSNSYGIKLYGGNEITVYQGITFTDPGYVAYDKKGNNISNQVKVKGSVEINVVGRYTITYSVDDKSVNRIVNVVEKPQIVTVIHLTGDLNVSMNVGSEYKEPGYSAIDAKDGDITSKVEVTNNIDASKAGIYRVTYSVVNSDGVTTTVSRTVTVK